MLIKRLVFEARCYWVPLLINLWPYSTTDPRKDISLEIEERLNVLRDIKWHRLSIDYLTQDQSFGEYDNLFLGFFALFRVSTLIFF